MISIWSVYIVGLVFKSFHLTSFFEIRAIYYSHYSQLRQDSGNMLSQKNYVVLIHVHLLCYRNLAESRGFSVLPAFCGHGIGSDFHALPEIMHIRKLFIYSIRNMSVDYTARDMLTFISFSSLLCNIHVLLHKLLCYDELISIISFNGVPIPSRHNWFLLLALTQYQSHHVIINFYY